MANAKRPALRKHDRVMLASHKSVIPPYDGKPFVLRDTVLTVSHLTGTGSNRNPWHVVVTDGTHFWHLEPDDVTRVETGEGRTMHSTMKQRSPKHDLDNWLDRHGYSHAHARKQTTPHPYAVSSRMDHATRKRGDEPKFQVGDIVRRSAARMRSMGIVSGPVNGMVVGHSGPWALIRWSDMRESDEPMSQAEEGLELDKRAMAKRAVGHARMIHQEPTGREVFAAHERGHHITTSGRRALSRAQFALPPGPEEKQRGIKGRLPIDTLKRARNALQRASQMRKRGHITAGQLTEVRRAVHGAWPSIDIEA